jgi:hypothetical protein
MIYLVLKTLVSAAILVAASEIAKRSTLLGGLIIALPLNSMLAFSWLYIDTRDPQRVAALSQSVMLLILPSLVFFVLMPLCLKAGLSFGLALAIAAGATLIACWLWSLLLARFGISF